MRTWTKSGWDVNAIFDYALSQHASYMNNKSMPVPPVARASVESFLRRLGYRLVLRRLRHAAATQPGAALEIEMEWDNVGVAPPYLDALVAIRLRPVAGGTAHVATTRTTIRGWLPGAHVARETVLVPQTLPAGTYELAVGVVDPRNAAPSVRLAIDGRTPDGGTRCRASKCVRVGSVSGIDHGSPGDRSGGRDGGYL